MKTAVARETTAKVSLKHSRVLCKAIKGKRMEKAKKLLEDLVKKRKSLDGKYYTKASKKFLGIVKTIGANAKNKNLTLEKLFIKNAVANKGETTIRPRTKWHLRGTTAKSTNIEITVEER
jgi:large subunit ribosomal protein L22